MLDVGIAWYYTWSLMVARFSSLMLFLSFLTVVVSGNALSELARVADDSEQTPHEIPLGDCNEEEENEEDGSDEFVALLDKSSTKIATSLQEVGRELHDAAAIVIALHGPDSPRAPPIVFS